MIESRCLGVLCDAAAAFRLGQEGAASQLLVQGIDQLGDALGSLPPALIDRLQTELGAALEAQQRRDFLRVADLIEYVLVPLFLGEGTGAATVPFGGGGKK